MSRDKYMKIFYSYTVIVMSWLLSSCTAELMNDVSDEMSEQPLYEVDVDGVYGVLPQFDNVDLQSRTCLVYDITNKNMAFSWQENDKIGVYAYTDNHSSVQEMVVKQAAGLRGLFAFSNNEVEALIGNKTYYAYRPLISGDDVDPNKIPFDLSNQSNAANAKYNKYKDSATNQEYIESEKNAASHLNSLDLSVTDATETLSKGGCTFEFNRQFAVARFYMKCPAAEMFDSLLFVIDNPHKFDVAGTVNLFTKESTSSHQRNVISLKYGEGDTGLDMTNKSSDYYYNNIGYIISYMMLPPIDLRDAKHLYVYLCSHTGTGGDMVKHYWEADIAGTASNKVNLPKNGFKQFTSGSNNEAIEFKINPISVEQWEVLQEGWLNENGSGTEGW